MVEENTTIHCSEEFLQEVVSVSNPCHRIRSKKNGVAERMIGTLTGKARAMMLDSQAPKQFWAEAL